MRHFHMLALVAVTLTTTAIGAQSLREVEETGLSGEVLGPDGLPVSAGTVVVRAGSVRLTTNLDPTGRFRIVPSKTGFHELRVSAPGLAPYRIAVDVPPSRTVALPVIQLSPATYFRARFETRAGHPILSPRLRRHFHDLYGSDISDPLEIARPDHIAADGTLTIGPLPLGITRLVFDTPPYAQTRLPDIHVNGSVALLDGGTIAIDQGAALHVDIADGAGMPVVQHDITLEEVAPFPVIEPRLERTNKDGRATFDRLAAGQYRVRVKVAGLCERRQLYITRIVAVPGNGTSSTRLIVAGRVTFRLTSPFGPLKWIGLIATPNFSSPPATTFDLARLYAPPVGRFPLPRFSQGTYCGGTTDAEGRLTLASFPPGPATVRIRVLNSVFVQLVNVPVDGSDVAVFVPEGYLPVRVTDAGTKNPVPSATITWTGGGARVEATTSNGDALLTGVAATPGMMSVSARGYKSAEEELAEFPPAYEVALTPEPSPAVHARVVTSSGEPIPDAVVQLTPANPMDVAQIATSDAKGVVNFSAAPMGSLRIIAAARGYVVGRMQLSPQTRRDVMLTLSRGYRVLASVEVPKGTGVYRIRVINDARQPIDDRRDLETPHSNTSRVRGWTSNATGDQRRREPIAQSADAVRMKI
ncbi:MAG: carboxypeptidase regulatory-like domain-containing protein [Acidobacteria bacterium]|nr:carboxypeptidase regulatory-like domain-containing protein [Acidobacteriota bacterium]